MKVSPARHDSATDGMIMQGKSETERRRRSVSSNSDLPGTGIPEQANAALFVDSSRHGNKRKSIPSPADGKQHDRAASKKPKLEANEDQSYQLLTDKALLPSEIWQRIFTFVPPKALGNLLQVNKLFNVYLDPGSHFNNHLPLPTSRSCTKHLKPDAIWQISRRLYWPGMPAPLKDRTELDMWRLCCRSICELCEVAKVIHPSQERPDPWRMGPGINGLAAVFAFNVASCGPCLLRNSVKEIDILLSSTTPSSLIPALPYIFVTDELNVVSPSTVATFTNRRRPETTKLYWASAIESVKTELQLVKGLGSAAVEEWIKGLETRGKGSRSNASRWEKWAVAGGVVDMRKPAKLPASNSSLDLMRAPDAMVQLKAREDSGASTPINTQIDQCGRLLPVAQHEPQGSAASGLSSLTGSTAKPHQNCETQGRTERTREEAAALKALRRAEIERRAMLIDPPLPPNVLGHVPSFQAAIQITAPLDENAWELLRPRLLAQRADAEKKEDETLAKARMLNEANDPGPKEVSDKDWDDIQGPVRARMAKYADEIIRNSWGKGRKVNKENSPRFAAEVLLSVRTRFYAAVEKDAAVAIAAGQQPRVDPPEGPFTQKLTLENMKWVFDTKIKVHTEQYRKELFLCNGCESTRYYGFEGVIQHYAAKHTKALSLGNVVVHWRAEWPEPSPFNPNPRAPRYSRHGPPNASHHHMIAGAPTYQDHEGFYQNGPIRPPLPTYPFSTGAVPLSTYPPQPVNSYGPSTPYHADGPLPFPFYYASKYGANTVPQSSPPAAAGFGPYPPGPPKYPPSIPGPPYPAQHQSSAPTFQGNAQPQYSAPQGLPFQASYHAQLEYLARSARDIWNALSNVKELPGALKVYVTIHHLVKRFWTKFASTPTLRMFNDGLSNNKDMRPVRNVNVMCKACNVGLGNTSYVRSDRKSFSLPQLANHFEKCHLGHSAVESHPQLGMDWTQDMVLLPEMPEVSDLKAVLGAKSYKFNLVHEAVPWAFDEQYPPPRLRTPGTPATAPPHGTSHPFPARDRPSPDTLLGSEGNMCWWPDSWYAHEITGMQQELGARDKAFLAHGERMAASLRDSSIGTYRQGETAERLSSPYTGSHCITSWGGISSPAALDVGHNNVFHQNRDWENDNRPRGDFLAGYSPDHLSTSLASGGHHPVREQLRDPCFFATEPHTRRASVEYREHDSRLYQRSDWEGSARTALPPRPVMSGERTLSASAGIKIPRSAGPRPNEPNDFSLTAALESHLAQERDRTVYPQKIERSVWNASHRNWRTTAYNNSRGVAHHDHHDVQIDSSRDGTFCKDKGGSFPHHGTYQDRYPSDSYEGVNPPRSGASPPSGRATERRNTYAGEMRGSPVQYEEAYEIVHVRDAEGEFVIRRPILRERDPSRALYELDHRVPLERESRPPTYHTVYEPPVRETKHSMRPPPTLVREDSATTSRTGNNSLAYEEYDPRNPAPVPSPSGRRDVSY